MGVLWTTVWTILWTIVKYAFWGVVLFLGAYFLVDGIIAFIDLSVEVIRVVRVEVDPVVVGVAIGGALFGVLVGVVKLIGGRE